MKKRMFITTIVMMLVLAVALTTSSLAWFSSANATVTASAASFRASAASGSNVNIKIRKSENQAWSNDIALVDGATRAMEGVIPQAPLVADYDSGTSTFTWQPTMKFNQAKIYFTGSDNKFVIDYDAAGLNYAQTNTSSLGTLNKVNNFVTSYDEGKDGVAANSGVDAGTASTPFYYDEFYIKNADSISVINSLRFDVTGTMTTIHAINAQGQGAEENDTACQGFAAFILFEQQLIEVAETPNVVPTNALEGAGKKVVAAGTANPAADEVVAQSAEGYIAWIPFAAFSIVINQKTSGQENTNPAWQFADLDARDTTEGKFAYNGVVIDTLKTQSWDGYSGLEHGFTLNQTNLRTLNNKNGKDAQGAYIDVVDDQATRNAETTWSMSAQEVYKVGFYFWLDGYTMTSDTDTTVARDIAITINAAQ